MNKLILLRHGQSQWNLENKFTGWKNVPLTKKGEMEAKKAAGYFTSKPKESDGDLDTVIGRKIEE